MLDAIVTASSGLQGCSGNCPVRKSWSNVQTPRLSPARNWPPKLDDNNVVTSACTAGSRLLMSADVSKINRKRSPPICGAVWARPAGTKKNSAQSANAIAARRRKSFGRFISSGIRTALESVPLLAVVIFQLVLQFRQRAFNHADEIRAARHRAAETVHRVTLRPVVRDHEHLAVRLATVRRALNPL